MDRRGFLKLAGIAPLTMIAPDVLAAPVLPGAALPGGPKWDRILVLVELKGGNDGLNTVVPFRDPAYYSARPRIGVQAAQVLQLGGDSKVGLHPNLNGLMPVWNEHQMAIVQGVGYSNPNRSHFRSIEIWETGSESNEYKSEGWLARLFQKQAPPQSFAADGIVIGNEDVGPLAGGARALSMNDPDQFMRQAQNVRGAGAAKSNPALAHILGVKSDLEHAVNTLKAQVQSAPALKNQFPANQFGRQMETAAKLLMGHVPLAVIKVTLGGFDTHSNQVNTHQRLMRELGDGLAAFRTALQQGGLWDKVLVMTYSEFGRRVGENGSQGTDHGTAAPHILMGGKVKGGLYGAQPSLTNLDAGDMRFSVDYRDLYATAAEGWWGLPAGSQGSLEHRPVNCLMA